MFRALDLFCGAGGVSRGLVEAGFEVVGVDLHWQKRYPYEFHQLDALEALRSLRHGEPRIDFIWASPPCQGYTRMNAPGKKTDHPKLIEPVRELLKEWGGLYCIENVEGAPLENPVTLCGSHFDLGCIGHTEPRCVGAHDMCELTKDDCPYCEPRPTWFQLQRHRLFETNFEVHQPECRHVTPTIGVYGGHIRCRSGEHWRDTGADFPHDHKPTLAAQAMGIDWMTMNELSEAIPPAYALHIGRHAVRALLHRSMDNGTRNHRRDHIGRQAEAARPVDAG